MKPFDMTLLAIAVLIFTISIPVYAQSGGPYVLEWSTIDGGGGRSTGGDFALVGTIGQPDAGQMSAGDYVLSGGFWPGGYGCIVNFTDLANFCAQWLLTDPGLEADLGGTQGVDFVDFSIFAYYWLYECPPDWPLK